MKYLEELKQGRACTWQVSDIRPQDFAYQIREALHVASIYPEEFPELARAHKDFSITVTGEATVAARLRRRPFTAQVTGVASGVAARQAPLTQGLAVAGRPDADGMLAPGTAGQIIGHVLQQAPSNGPFYYPNAHLSNDELVKLWVWCQKQTPGWLLFESEGAITVRRTTRELADLAWTPEDIGEDIPEIEPSPESSLEALTEGDATVTDNVPEAD